MIRRGLTSKSMLVASMLGAAALLAALKNTVGADADDSSNNGSKQLTAVVATVDVLAESQQAAGGSPLKEFTLDEVVKRNSQATGVWITYKDGVYDISQFVAAHPGGADKIMLAAGGAIDPYWDMYAIHKNLEVFELLEQYRVGKLSPGEYAKKQQQLAKHRQQAGSASSYANDPARSPVLLVHSDRPFNAETPLLLLADDMITPSEMFYVRNHLPVPRIEPGQYQLTVRGEGIPAGEVRLSLDDLKTKFKQHTITTTIQCAGNRRSEMNRAKPVKGVDWHGGAIGTAAWTGVKLRDVLQYAGLDLDAADDNPRIKHVQFEGYDKDESTKSIYGGSIPAHKALDARGDVLLAFQMNGSDIPVDHGFPVRAIVPGVVGARNVKWLSSVIVSDQESSNHFQQRDYKAFSPAEASLDQLDYSRAPAIQELPVTSAICLPKTDAVVSESDGFVSVKGYAWSGGGRDIVRVDVTADGGQSWQVADQLRKLPDQKPGRAWAWSLFEAQVPIPPASDQSAASGEGRTMRICSKATDEAVNAQPENAIHIWNARGFLTNVWSCIDVHVKKD